MCDRRLADVENTNNLKSEKKGTFLLLENHITNKLSEGSRLIIGYSFAENVHFTPIRPVGLRTFSDFQLSTLNILPFSD